MARNTRLSRWLLLLVLLSLVLGKALHAGIHADERDSGCVACKVVADEAPSLETVGSPLLFVRWLREHAPAAPADVRRPRLPAPRAPPV